MKYLLKSICFIILCYNFTLAQSISVNMDDYKQEFQGSGATISTYLGHYLSMSTANQLEASRMLYEDLKMTELKYFPGDLPSVDPNEYDKTSTAITNAKVYNPNIVVVMNVQNLPNNLEKKDANGNPIKGEHDESLPGIMDSIANYYFQVCKGYHDRGHVVDILELINERAYVSKVTDLYDIAVDKFKAMISDPTINTTNIPMPLISGPATWNASSPATFINGWKSTRPNAWANVDIVSSHGYENGTESSYQGTFDIAEGKPFHQSEQTGKLQRGENAGVDVIAEQFPAAYPKYIENTEIARHMIDFYNGGGNAFYCFLTNNPKFNSNAAVLTTTWGGTPIENSIYHGFKHLSATQPLGSKRVTSNLTNMDNYKTVAFREQGQNTVYVHLTNLYNTHEQVTIDFKTNGIKSIQGWSTDEYLKFEEVINETYASSLDKLVYNVGPYSTHTVKVLIDPNGSTATQQPQTITFNAISDKLETDADFTLTGSVSSSLNINYEVVEGPAIITGNSISLTGIGKVVVKASQTGNNTVAPALDQYQSFYVWPATGTVNVALNKAVTVNSTYNSTYVGSKAVDGNKSSNSSRWLTQSSAAYPHWIEVDFGVNKTINSFAFWMGYNGYKNPVNKFDFEIWNGSTWKSVHKEYFTENPIYLASFQAVTTSKIRLYMEEGEAIVKMFELEVYEAPISIPPPTSPTDLTTSNTTLNSINLTWVDNSNDEDGFKIERKQGSGGTYTEIASLTNNTISYNDAELLEGTEYFYRVIAFNSGGNSAYSNETSATTLFSPPSDPSELAVSNITFTEVTLTWTDNSNNETGFILERRFSGPNQDYSTLATLGANTTTYTDNTLTAGQRYFYRIKAVNNGSESGHSNFVDVIAAGCTDCIDFNITTNVAFSQDASANVTILDGGATIRLADNTWRRTNQTYTVTANTVLEFEFMSTFEGEIQGIGLDENNNSSSNRMFNLYGTQNWGNTTYNYTTSGSYQLFSIPVGTYYTGTAMYLVLMNDHDNGSGSNSHFKNVRIYENGTAKIASQKEKVNQVTKELTKISVYPVPSKSFITIKGINEKTPIKIFSHTGQLVLEKDTEGYIDISNLSNGLYLISIKEQVLKFIKQ